MSHEFASPVDVRSSDLPTHERGVVQSDAAWRRRVLAGLGALGAVLATPRVAGAATVRVVRLIAPVAAGSGADLMGRRFAEALGRVLGAAAIVDNRPGATGLLAARALSHAAPDGWTLGILGVGLATIQAMGAPIDLLRDFAPVARITNSPLVFVVGPNARYAALSDLLAAARQSPGRLSFASGGIGSRAHLCVEHLGARVGGLELVHVPFKAAGDGMIAVAGGEVSFGVALLSGALPLLRIGRLRALAVTGARRVALIADVPTVAESGFPGYVYDVWGGLFAPARTQAGIVAATAGATAEIAMEPAFRSFVESQGDQVTPSQTPQEFRETIARSLEAETALVRKLGLKFN